MFSSQCKGGSGNDTIKDSTLIVGNISVRAGEETVICSVDDIKDYKYMVIQNYNGGNMGEGNTYAGYTTIIPIPLLLYGVTIHNWMTGYYNICYGQLYKRGNNIVATTGKGNGGSTILYGSITVYK